MSFYEVVTVLEQSPIPYTLYFPNRNYLNDFFHIFAKPEDIHPWSDALDWSLISTMYKPIKESNCQSLGAGFGFTSGLCNSQDDTINVIHASKPRKGKNTHEKLVLHCFETTSSFTSSQKYKWIDNKIWHDKKHPNRRRDYAQQISKNNTTKQIYFGKTGINNLLGCHCDKISRLQ